MFSDSCGGIHCLLKGILENLENQKDLVEKVKILRRYLGGSLFLTDFWNDLMTFGEVPLREPS